MFQKKVKFLHCADLHLDMPFYNLNSRIDISSERRQDLKKVFLKIINSAKIHDVDIIIICGDLYEHDYVSKSTITYINDRFSEVSQIKVIIVPGNHDPLLADSYYQCFNWSSNVNILSLRDSVRVFDDLGICVHGAGFESFREDCSLVENVKIFDSNLINILVTHGTLDMNIGKGIYNPIASKELDKLGMDYIALGHFHNKLEGLGENKNIYNPGSPEPLGFDEPGEHGVIIGTIEKSNDRCKLETYFVELSEKKYKTLDIDVNYAENDEQVLDRIHHSLLDEELEATLLRINLKGFVDEGFKADIPFIVRELQEVAYYVKIIDNTEPARNLDKLIKEPGLIGVYAKNIKARMDLACDSEKKILRDALYYGLSAIERGKIDI